MLVLEIKLNEEITIGDDIKVVLLKMRPGKVRLGIDAPRELAIHREGYEARTAGKEAG